MHQTNLLSINIFLLKDVVLNCLDIIGKILRELFYFPAEPVVSNVCQQGLNGPLHFPHPTDTTKFLQCAPGGRMFIIKCPENEVYDQGTTSCGLPKPVSDINQMKYTCFAIGPAGVHEILLKTSTL